MLVTTTPKEGWAKQGAVIKFLFQNDTRCVVYLCGVGRDREEERREEGKAKSEFAGFH